MTPHRSREDLAVEIWVALETANSDGMSMAELSTHTGFTRNQVKTGLNEINHVKQLANEQPIAVNVRAGWKYVLPEYYQDDLLPWTRNRMKDLFTRLEAEQARIDAAAKKWPEVVSRSIPRLVKRLLEDLSEVKELIDVEAEGS